MLVSLYILCYNHQDFIEESIIGALSQTYSPLQIVISDDYSTDNTWDIINACTASYKGPHEIIIRRNIKNLGISEHINEVWKHCSGSWIVASAGDDISESNRVKTIVEFVRRYPNIKLFQSYLLEVDTVGNEVYMNTLNIEPSITRSEAYIPNQFAESPFNQQGAAMAYSRDVFERFGKLPSNVIFEDNIVLVRAALLGGCGAILMPLVRHRNHDGQITNSYASVDADIIIKRIKKRTQSDLLSAKDNLKNIYIIDSESTIVSKEYIKYHEKKLNDAETYYKAINFIWPYRLWYFIKYVSINTKNEINKRDKLLSLLPNYLFMAVLYFKKMRK